MPPKAPGYLIDTNVLSNRSDARRDPNVREWLRRYSRLIRISVVTIAEMHRGLLLLEARIAAADGKLRTKMTAALRSKPAWYDEVLAVFADRIEPIGLDVAQRWGRRSVQVPLLAPTATRPSPRPPWRRATTSRPGTSETFGQPA